MIRKNIILVVASKGYQPVEYEETKKTLKKGGVSVITASDSSGMAIASDKSTTEAKLDLNNIIPDRYDGIFFIGGPGTMDNLDNKISYKLIQKASDAGILYGAICISPRILAKAGVLKNKKATGWDGDNELDQVFAKHNVIREQKDVVIDKNIVTASGPKAAKQFGQAILTLLQNQPEE